MVVSIGGCKPCTIFPSRAHNELAPTQFTEPKWQSTNDNTQINVGGKRNDSRKVDKNWINWIMRGGGWSRLQPGSLPGLRR